MAIVTRGGAVKKNLKFFIWGEAGTWKSSLAMQLAALKKEDGSPVKLLYVDAEYGSIDNYLEDFCEEYGVEPDNRLIVKANTYDEIEEYIEKGINNEDFYIEDEEGNLELVLDANGEKFVADAIVLDSATVIQDTTKYAMIQTSEKRARIKAEKKELSVSEKFVAEQTAGMEFKDYDKLNHKGKNLLRSLITKTNKMVAVTSRQKDKKDKVKNSKGEFETVKVGVMPDCFKDAEYEFFTVLHTYEDEETGEIYAKIVRKDRTGQFPPNHVIKNPTLFPWQDVINSNIGKKEMKNSKESYDEIVNKQAQELQKTKHANLDLVKNEDKDTTKNVQESDQETSVDVFNKIKKIRLSLPSSKRSGLMSELTKAGLPKPSSNLPIEDLKNILKCAENYKTSIEE